MPNPGDNSRKRRSRTLVYGEFTPDQPDLESSGLTQLRNAIPLSTGRYGPARGLRQLSSNSISELAEVDRICGSICSFTNLDTADITMFAGGFSNSSSTLRLFGYSDDGKVWSDVTRSSGPYGFSASRHARFCQHGNNMFAAVGRGAPLQSMQVGTEPTFSDIPGAPNATDIAVVREFLVAINFSQGGVLFPDSVAWSSRVDPKNWPTAGSVPAFLVSSGRAQIPGGGPLHRIVPGIGGADAIIFAETRIWRMTFVGPPSIWQFDVAAYEDGTKVPGSVSGTNEIAIYYGRGSFRRFDGARSEPIAVAKVDDTFLNDPNIGVRTTGENGFQAAIASAIDTTRNIYLLSYPTPEEDLEDALLTEDDLPILTEDDETIDAITQTGKNDAILIYNYVTGQWGYAGIEIDAIGQVDTQTTTIDQPMLVGIGPDNFMSDFNGDTLELTITSPEMIASNAMREIIIKILPGTDAANVLTAISARNRLADTPTKFPYRGMENDGYAPVDNSGVGCRYWRVHHLIPAGDEWTFIMGAHCETQDLGEGGL